MNASIGITGNETRFDILEGLNRHDRALIMLKKSDIYPLMLFDTLRKIRDNPRACLDL